MATLHDELRAWLEQGGTLLARLEAGDTGEAGELDAGVELPEASPAPAPDESFSTPALVANAPPPPPAQVPTIEPVDEAEVPAQVKQDGQA